MHSFSLEDLEERYRRFLEEAEEVAGRLEEIIGDGAIRIISHLDADGLTSAGVICSVLNRKDAIYHLSVLRQLTVDDISRLKSEDYDFYVFTDLGSGQLDLIIKALSEKKKIVVLDHHPPSASGGDNVIHLNPHLFGIDGAREASSSSVVFSVAYMLDESNIDLCPLAVVGAIGDRQDKGEDGALVGLNDVFVEEGVRRGYIEVRKDIKLFGRETRPIHVALEYTTDPFIPGLTGDRMACLNFVRRVVGINIKDSNGRWRTLSDLSEEEKRAFVSGLVNHMIMSGLSSAEAESIVGIVYTFPHEKRGSPLRDAREYASLLNACGRMGYPTIGVIVCMGDRGEFFKRAMDIMGKYRENLARYVNWLLRNKSTAVVEMENIRYVHGGDFIDDRMIGTVISLALSTRIVNGDKPVLGLAYLKDFPDKVKISARTTEKVVQEGVDLGAALRRAIEELGLDGIAGGHDIAAGGQIPRGKEEEFLRTVDRIVGSMRRGSNAG
ncbi:MAG: DHH family phosphoesterase [Candidatus Baldrarchaeia archaeon]